MVQIAAGVSGQVGAAVSSVCGKSGAQAVSRLFDRPETCLDSVLAGHVAETRKRCAGAGRILAIQDTTTLDFSSHRCTEGLGPVSGDETGLGLLMHSVLAASDERVPLGMLGLHVWSRDAVASAPLIGVYEVEAPRQGSRAKRTASLEVRVMWTLLRPPVNRTDDVSDTSVAVSLIWAVERNVPVGVKGLDWTLLAGVAPNKAVALGSRA